MIALGYWYYSFYIRQGSSSFADWPPTPTDIVRELGTNQPGVYTDARHQRFTEMIKHRYRFGRVPAMAVGLKFESNTRLKLLCAASIPRWHMSRLAVQVFKECQMVFGKDYEIDIYETYIAMDQKKLAEARLDPVNRRVAVLFDEKFEKASRKTYRYPQPLSRPFGARIRLEDAPPKRINASTTPLRRLHGSSGAFR
jgi:hypothetical protein